MSYYDYQFRSRIESFGVGKTRKIWYTVVFLPEYLAGELPLKLHPRLRVKGEIEDTPFQGACIPTGDGRHYLIVSRRLIQEAQINLDSLIEVRFSLAGQDDVDVPQELSAEIAANPWAKTAWAKLSAGKRRALSHTVSSARTAATRLARVRAAISALANDVLPASDRRSAAVARARKIIGPATQKD